MDPSKIKIEFLAEKIYQTDPCFLQHLRVLCEELSVPDALKAACFHEVGHLAYFRLLAPTVGYSPNEVTFVGPYVRRYFNAHTLRYEFDRAIAATRTPFDKDNFPYTNETLWGLAKGCFAGGVFTNEFAEGSPRGDEDDRKRFHEYYIGAIKQCGLPEKRESQLEIDAIAAVTADLQNADFRRLAELLADQCELECLSKAD